MGRILAAIGIVVNLFLPGVGSLIMGKWTTGLVQLGVLAVVWVLKMVSFGFLGPVLWPVSGIVWLWALVGGILTYIDRGRPREALNRPRL
ncbi:MAG: hypothetical protein OWU84_07710 [Firmicutes bacterium]|nr:hypothetical protein [Bacillota bacterium]